MLKNSINKIKGAVCGLHASAVISHVDPKEQLKRERMNSIAKLVIITGFVLGALLSSYAFAGDGFAGWVDNTAKKQVKGGIDLGWYIAMAIGFIFGIIGIITMITAKQKQRSWTDGIYFLLGGALLMSISWFVGMTSDTVSGTATTVGRGLTL